MEPGSMAWPSVSRIWPAATKSASGRPRSSSNDRDRRRALGAHRHHHQLFRHSPTPSVAGGGPHLLVLPPRCARRGGRGSPSRSAPEPLGSASGGKASRNGVDDRRGGRGRCAGTEATTKAAFLGG